MGITAECLEKYYGSRCAVSGLSFRVDRGTVLGFIGPNGAGKTTAMRMLCGILKPSAGRVLVDGIDPAADPVAAHRLLGYLPENAPLYGNMTVESFLGWCGAMRGLRGRALRSALARVMHIGALEDVASDEIDALSKGYRRRVCLAQAIIHSPPVLALDEPTDGLDPNQKRQVHMLIRGLREQCAIIVSTHILEEIGAVCDAVLTLCAGRQVFAGSVAEFRAVSGGSLEEAFAILTADREKRA